MADRSAYDAIDAIHWTTLRAMRVSPLHYQHALRVPRVDTDAFRRGRLVHVAVLEPDELPCRYVVCDRDWLRDPRLNRSTKEGKAWWQDWLAAHPGDRDLDADGYKRVVFAAEHPDQEMVAEWDYRTALAIRDAVRRNPAAVRLLDGGTMEQPIYWVDPASGLPCKAIPDCVSEPGIVEVKTARDAVDVRRFAAACYSLGYHGQMGLYQMAVAATTGREQLPGYIIAVESDAPHDVAVYRLDDNAVWFGAELAAELLIKVRDCIAAGDWPGALPGERLLCLPEWAYPDQEGPAVLGWMKNAGGSEPASQEG